MLPLLVLLGTIAGAWYLLIVRPQKDQQTRHGRLVERLQVGDHVLTVGGIYGRVVATEGTSVVLELAPGLTSRMATDGIARIVHDSEAALPQTRTEDHMQHPPHPQHPHQQLQPQPQHAPTVVMPVAVPTPHAAQPPVPQYTQPAVPYQGQPPVQLPPPPPPGQVTLRAHVEPAPQHLAAPRPWAGVAPAMPAPASIAGRGPALQAPAAPHPHVQQPQPAMPVHMPFAPAQPQPPQHAGFHYAQPAHAPAMHQAQHVPAPVEAPARRHSRAPQGMGSSLRLDDPSLRDTMERARSERSGLAEEYRKVVAPLVDTGGDALPLADAGWQHAPGGQAPQPSPLFAAGAAPVAQYPAPIRPPVAAHGFPRPARTGPDAGDAAAVAAFQRRTPLTQHVEPTPPPAAPAPAHA